MLTVLPEHHGCFLDCKGQGCQQNCADVVLGRDRTTLAMALDARAKQMISA